MNPDLDRLQPYPFERLARLKAGLAPPADREHIALSIGEPKHPTPSLITAALEDALPGVGRYAATRGLPAFREAIADWLGRRYGLGASGIDPDTQILPVSGTREALFAIAQTVVNRQRDAAVVMPNPFYQIYEGAALLAGARPVYLNAGAENGYRPDLATLAERDWADCQLVYVCSPGNPAGQVLDTSVYSQLLALADRHDFVVAADECYAELYRDEQCAPTGLLQACRQLGRDDYRRCLVFHSLSKRSSAPGLRSGFVAGDAGLIERFLLYRTYQGCAMPEHVQQASIAAWRDETHVRDNRALYRAKFDAVAEILSPVLDLHVPPAGFYLWPELPMDDITFARDLFERENVTVLPGRFLSREAHGTDPGAYHARIALVAEPAQCIEAARRIGRFLESA